MFTQNWNVDDNYQKFNEVPKLPLHSDKLYQLPVEYLKLVNNLTDNNY